MILPILFLTIREENRSLKRILRQEILSRKCLSIAEKTRSLHSKEAEKKLMSLAVIGKVERSKNEKIYLKI